MNIEQMVKKLNEIGVPKHYYSINENLSSDTHVLNHIYGKWEYFYFDLCNFDCGYLKIGMI